MTDAKVRTGRPASPAAVGQILQQANQHFLAGNLQVAAETYRTVLRAEPDNATALANLGTTLCTIGDMAAGIAHLSRAIERNPADDNARNNLVNACQIAFARAAGEKDYATAVAHGRTLMAHRPDTPGLAEELSLCLFISGRPATLADIAPALNAEQLGAKILVACMPKSGSTWLSHVLLTLTGFANAKFSSDFIQNEQELHLPHVLAYATQDTVTQQHCRATAGNLHIMQAFGFRPVVLVRNLFDTIASLLDFYAAGAVRNSFVYSDYDSLDEATKLDLIIDMVAPWYVQFYLSWALAERENAVPFLWMTYEAMMADKAAALARIAGFCGLERTDSEIAAALARVDGEPGATRFNKGVSGRGEALLSREQKDRLRRLTSYFPSVDFAPIGLA